MTRKIFALAGSKGAGKTTAYNAIKEKFGETHEITLAGHLKRVCAQVFKIDENLFHDPKLKEKLLEDPIYIEAKQLDSVIRLFGHEPKYNDNIRPFIGKIIDTPRELLQYIGTEVLHTVDPLIHVNYTSRNLPKTGVLVVTDLRFLNEFDHFNNVHRSEFIPFYIQNNRAELAAEGDNHPSEKQLLLFKDKCIKIENNSTQHEFEENIVKLLREYL